VPVFCISYRLADDALRTQRQIGLMRAVHEVQRRFWDRTGNFVLFETAHTIDFLAGKFGQTLDPKRDLLVLIEIGTGRGIVCGETTDPDILAILPDCRMQG
jgi:hypothetical protein